MKPGEPLYDRFLEKIVDITPTIFFDAEMSQSTSSLLDYVRRECSSVSLPRLGHYVTALRRVMHAKGVAIPDGKIYKTPSYENFTIIEAIGGTEIETSYVNRLLVLTSDNDESKGRIANFIDRILDDNPNQKGTFVIFAMITPKEVTNVINVDAIAFALVQAASGETFGFVFKPNPNIGKVRASEGMSDESGEIRERIGSIDRCSIEAELLPIDDMAHIRLELNKAAASLVDKPDTQPAAQSIGNVQLQTFGKSLLSRLGFTTNKTPL